MIAADALASLKTACIFCFSFFPITQNAGEIAQRLGKITAGLLLNVHDD